jgi:hypothetical protein
MKNSLQNTMTLEQINNMISWFRSEAEKLTKEIHQYNDRYDHYNAAKAEGMRDSYIRCINKLNELKSNK